MKFVTYRKLTPISLLAKLIRGIARLIQWWPWVLIIVLVFSPITPHVRLEYRYHPSGNSRIYVECHYIGVQGVARFLHRDDCHAIIFLHHKPRISL